mmetsp:Transcript_3073/g.8332  ORF Transcript_3073/g.8332 Transcript_3073/m.8332 type:complete len:109 (+) Transcript_3073:2156-2482(+)
MCCNSNNSFAPEERFLEKASSILYLNQGFNVKSFPWNERQDINGKPRSQVASNDSAMITDYLSITRLAFGEKVEQDIHQKPRLAKRNNRGSFELPVSNRHVSQVTVRD